jgi:hypothetical protein
MEPSGVPSIATPPFFVFGASIVQLKMGTDENSTANYTVESTLLPRI